MVEAEVSRDQRKKALTAYFAAYLTFLSYWCSSKHGGLLYAPPCSL